MKTRRIDADRDDPHFHRMAVAGDVQDGCVLDVRVFADANVINIPADDRVKPDARVLANLNVAYNLGALFNKCTFPELGDFA